MRDCVGIPELPMSQIHFSIGHLAASAGDHGMPRTTAPSRSLSSSACFYWSGQRDLNPRPSAPKASGVAKTLPRVSAIFTQQFGLVWL